MNKTTALQGRSFSKHTTGIDSGIRNKRLWFGLLLITALACAEHLPDDPDVKLRWIINGSAPAWSPSGKYIMYSLAERYYGVVRLWINPLAGGEARRLTSISEISVEQNGCWLPNMEKDGFLFIFESAGMNQIRVGNVDDGKTNFLYQTVSPIEQAAGNADGSVAVFTRLNSVGLWRFNKSDIKAELIENTDGWRDPRYPRFGADDREVWYVDSDESGTDNMYRIDINGGAPTQTTFFTSGTIDDLTLSADRTLGAFIHVISGPVQEISLVYRISIDNSPRAEPMEIGTYHAPQLITLSPDGRYLAYDNLDNYIRIIPFNEKTGP